MKNIITIIKKQLKDTLKNMAVLIQFVMFPILAIIMTRAVRLDDMPPNFFVILFSTMYIGMAPLSRWFSPFCQCCPCSMTPSRMWQNLLTQSS